LFNLKSSHEFDEFTRILLIVKDDRFGLHYFTFIFERTILQLNIEIASSRTALPYDGRKERSSCIALPENGRNNIG